MKLWGRPLKVSFKNKHLNNKKLMDVNIRKRGKNLWNQSTYIYHFAKENVTIAILFRFQVKKN